MTITIAPALNQPGYCVTADLGCGLAHDFFPTQEAAVDFAQSFYGGTVETVEAEAIAPASLEEQILDVIAVQDGPMMAGRILIHCFPNVSEDDFFKALYALEHAGLVYGWNWSYRKRGNRGWAGDLWACDDVVITSKGARKAQEVAA